MTFELMQTLTSPDIFKNIFELDSTTSILEKILRPILVYIFLIIVLRVFGKRELAQLNPFDLVVLLSLSNTVQNAIIGADNSLSGGLIGAVSLLFVNYVVVRLFFKHRRLDQLIEGTETILMDKGKINKKALAKELISEPELIAVAHRQGFSNLKDVDQIILETNGTFSICGAEPDSNEKQYADLKKQLEDIQKQLAIISGRITAG
jgi:uncharacterized membrane protein YcaP (DUF421 family)